MVGLGTLLTSFGAVSDTLAGSPWEPGLETCWLVRLWPTPSPGFRLKVAEVHDVYMVISGESMCEEVHPCRVIMIYSKSRVLGYGLLGCLCGT